MERTFDDIVMDEAPATSSFMYKGKLITEEWVYLPLEKRQREGYIKPDVPYYHIAFQPLSYRITDGGMEGDNLEHTYVAIKTQQNELTPKGSGRDELVKAFAKLGFPRNTKADLDNNPAVGKIFIVKRYNRTYVDRVSKETRNAELMNVPADRLPDDWAPEPGSDIPVYPRARRERGSGGSTGGVSSGAVALPTTVSFDTVAKELAGTVATEAAVRKFVLDRNDLAQGDILDAALAQNLLEKLVAGGFVTVVEGKVTV